MQIKIIMTNQIKDALFGIAVGDALGVPVEFKSRGFLKIQPVTGMQGYGTHGQPAGTWSDDSSLTFCLAESLFYGYNTKDIAKRFVMWFKQAYWTAWGNVFDIGNTTHTAILNLISGIEPVRAGEDDEYSNGNGSLMRILPLAFYLKNKSIDERFKITQEVSSITHRHIRSVIACFIYIEYAINLINGLDKILAYNKMQESVNNFLDKNPVLFEERANFDNVLKSRIENLSESQIRGSGYVIHSLEAAFWCILRNNNFKDTVLEAVNLGEDTDTTGAITGGLSGLIYGFNNIPSEWTSVIAKKSEIEKLSEKLEKIFTLNFE